MTDITAQNCVNDPNIEIAWAIKASEFSSVHMNILMSVDTTKLKLNKYQDDVYKYFREMFPDMDVFETNEVQLKGGNKEKWRQFCEYFKETVDDYNFGTMLRIRADGIYDEANTIITQKVCFLLNSPKDGHL
uniref:Polysacc_synt_4 domain-containing protein n=1 Tax=Meloidogyne hapla TaxID=6305 RepID=A0A1I8BU19_MELHA